MIIVDRLWLIESVILSNNNIFWKFSGLAEKINAHLEMMTNSNNTGILNGLSMWVS